MKLSVLNLVPVREGQGYTDAIQSMITLARHVEHLNVARYWIAEHHNTKNLASSATSLLIGHTLAHTTSLKVGSGGVMLPNHSPYIVAEQYGTLASIYQGRVELGLGRAPGTDMKTAKAIRRQLHHPDFATDIAELRGYFDNTNTVSAYPAAGLDVPFYILGSSTESAYLAAELGLPYAFASHFAPRMLTDAVAIYKRNFKPSKQLDKPYVIVGVNAIVADTDDEAKSLATTQTQFFLSVVTNAQQKLQPPMCDDNEVWQNHQKRQISPHFAPVNLAELPIYSQERAVVEQMTACSLIGSPSTVAFGLNRLQESIGFDEIMAVSYIYDEDKQCYSYTLLKDIVDSLA